MQASHSQKCALCGYFHASQKGIDVLLNKQEVQEFMGRGVDVTSDTEEEINEFAVHIREQIVRNLSSIGSGHKIDEETYSREIKPEHDLVSEFIKTYEGWEQLSVKLDKLKQTNKHLRSYESFKSNLEDN